MNTWSPRSRVIGGLLLAVSMGGAALPSGAQQAPLRPGQSPGPRFIVPTLVGIGDGNTLGFQVARAVRKRIASDFDMRTLWVVPESTITKYLADAGYPADQPLSPAEVGQLANAFRADEFINGVVIKTPTGGYRVQANWALGPRGDMVQPLPPVEAAKISDVAKLVSNEFQMARRQVESVRRCNDLARARNYAGALAEARKAIDAYPRSVLARVCVANIYDQQKLGPDSMIRISEEILAIHPENRRALTFAANAYEAKGMDADEIRVLQRLLAVDAGNRGAALGLARALAREKRIDEARATIDSAVARYPDDAELLGTQWRIHLAARDWTGAVQIGQRYLAADSSAGTRDFYIGMAAAAEAAGDTQQALALASRGVERYPTDDELALLEVQFLRATGELQRALAAVDRLLARSPRTPNAWRQRARIQTELGAGEDSVTATLARAVEAGDDRGTVARYALSLGQAAQKAPAADSLAPLRNAIRYYKFAESVQPGDTTQFLLGTTSTSLAQRLAEPARLGRRCDLAKEMQDALVDAQIALPKSGRTFPTQVAAYLDVVGKLAPYAEQLARAVCR